MISWDFSPHAEQDTLARFVLDQCRTEGVIQLLNAAKDELEYVTADPVFDGYTSNRVSKIFEQVEALHLALTKRKPGLAWTLEPQDRSSAPMQQHIRSVAEILQQRNADCIDITVLFAALLISIGLNPCVVILGKSDTKTPSHALLGYWTDDQTFPTVKVWPSAMNEHIERLAFLETTAVLQGNKKPFLDATAEALQSLPSEFRDKAQAPASAREKMPARLRNASNVAILYLVDLRRALLDKARRIPIVAIMGVRGQVGKTSITTRMAELIAETRHNVLIVDFDIDSAGSTIFHADRLQVNPPPISTVYDYLLPYSGAGDDYRGAVTEGLWQITPDYLSDRQLGQVFLVPARPINAKGLYKIVADIDPRKRNHILRNVVDTILERSGLAEHEISCVIIDCGAGLNPIYFAALDRADPAFLVATPDRICFHNVEQIRREHQDNYPDSDMSKIQIVVNRVTEPAAETLWAPYRARFVREDPMFQQAYFRGAVYFDLGYDDFSLDTREVLAQAFRGSNASLVPDEIDIWVRPWIEQIVKRQLAVKILRSPRFRLQTAVSWVTLLLAADLTYRVAYYEWGLGAAETHQGILTSHGFHIVMAVCLLLSAASFAVAAWLCVRQWRHRQLLAELVRKGGNKEFLDALLRRSNDKRELRWLKGILWAAIEGDRWEEERRRVASRTRV